MNTHYPFTLTPLPYPENALKPYLNEITLCFHHDKHLKAYVDNLNQILAPYPQFHSWHLERLLKHLDSLPEQIRTPVKNNAGGVYNHELYFAGMSPNECAGPSGKFEKALSERFGSLEKWKAQMKAAALSQFGSGYAWLVLDKNRQLQIMTTPNQDSPVSQDLVPIITVDVWEHAYYLQYQNRRNEYLDNWFFIINWPFAENRYLGCI